MTTLELEKRIENLEAEVASLRSKVDKNGDATKSPWWKNRIGSFADDPAYDEAMRLGREYRQAQKINYDEDDD